MLIDRYGATASEIQCPAPTRWTRDSDPRRDEIRPLLLTFDSAGLQLAAGQFESLPPPEMTTPFLGADSR